MRDEEDLPMNPRPVRASPLYENCSVYSPGGALMFRCSRKKIEWYLNRNLAVPLTTASQTEIRLVFEPKGQGRVNVGDEYYLEQRVNQCVVCGRTGHLTAHHIVPYQYRKFMPLSIKSHASHDVVLLCTDCHDSYEIQATALKKRYAKQYDIPLDGRGLIPHPHHRRLHSAVNAIRKGQDKIPKPRLQELETVIRQFFSLHSDQDLTDEILDQALALPLYRRSDDSVEHGEVVVGNMSEADLDDFIRMWRQHFLNHMEPMYLSSNWKVDNPTRNM